jgi:formamidopyrimidine-DNA glycosylase
MPELPEVETVRRTLAPLIGARIAAVRTSGLPLHMNRAVDVRRLRGAAQGGVVAEVRRRGKYLLIDFVERPLGVLVHLGMSGRLRLVPAVSEPAPHTHVTFALAGDPRELRFSDPRRFGQVGVVDRAREREHPALARLGLDPLVDRLDGPTLHGLCRRSRQPLKTFLLDQHRIAGIGNIYASEALWVARLRPTLRAGQLSARRADALAAAVREVLEHALICGGTSLRDFVNATGDPGHYRDHLRVYDRAGQPCLRADCGGAIVRTVTQGRATFHCPRCQTR